MIHFEENERQRVLSMLSGEMSLSADQKTALKSEITNDPEARNYAGMDDAQVLRAMALPYEVPNAPQTTIAKESIKSPDLYNYLATHAGADQIPYWIKIEAAGKDPSGQLGVACALIVSAVSHLAEITLGTQQVAGIEAALIGGGIVTQEVADALLKELDPSWSPTIIKAARIDVVLGGELMPTLAEIKAARS